MRRLPQSTAYTVMLQVFLASDHVSPATGKTVVVTISKAGGAFGNPNVGALNATEVANGWYKAALDTIDTGSLGDLVIVGTATSCDVSSQVCQVISATNGGLTALPAVAAEAAGGLYTRGSGAGQINQAVNGQIDTNPAVMLDLVAGVETGITPRQALRLMLGVLAGKASGLAGSTATYRDTTDTKNRVIATVDVNGNRTAVTLDAS